MARRALLIGLFAQAWSLCAGAQVTYDHRPAFAKAYGNIAVATTLWSTGERLPGISLVGGAVFPSGLQVGIGFGVENRSTEYLYLPVELGFNLPEAPVAVVAYGGPTWNTWQPVPGGGSSGSVWGVEAVYRPHFNYKRLKLLVAVGLNVNHNRGVQPDLIFGVEEVVRTVATGPRVRIGLSL